MSDLDRCGDEFGINNVFAEEYESISRSRDMLMILLKES